MKTREQLIKDIYSEIDELEIKLHLNFEDKKFTKLRDYVTFYNDAVRVHWIIDKENLSIDIVQEIEKIFSNYNPIKK